MPPGAKNWCREASLPLGDGRFGGAVEAGWGGTATGVSIIAIPDFPHRGPRRATSDRTTEAAVPT